MIKTQLLLFRRNVSGKSPIYYPSLRFPCSILRHPIVKYVNAEFLLLLIGFLYIIVSFSIEDICNTNGEHVFSQQHKRFLTRCVSVKFFSGFLRQGFLHYINFVIAFSDHFGTITFGSITRENTISCFPNELRHAIFFRAYNQNWWKGSFQ